MLLQRWPTNRLTITAAVAIIASLYLFSRLISSRIKPVPVAIINGPVTGNRVIVYLTYAGSSNDLTFSLATLFANFNQRFQYPVVIFFEEPLNLTDMLDSLNLKGVLRQQDFKLLLNFVRIKFSLPLKFIQIYGRNLEKLQVTPVEQLKGFFFPGYNHMISFWMRDIFEHPIMANVKYYWRLDCDSQLLETLSYDVFETMERGGYLYGYRLEQEDALHVTVGFWDFLESYLANWPKQGILFDQLPKIPPVHLRNKTKVPMYYNNFEVVHVPTFRVHPGIRRFTDEVIDSLNIYLKRWGDAPLRYISIALYLNKTKHVHHFCDIDYFHAFKMKPSC